MIYLAFGDSCAEARDYYYDFLGLEGVAKVPPPVHTHVEHCQHCRGQIDHLGHLLAEPHDEKIGRDGLTTQLLTLHFNHLGQEVTCACVKPFIPTLVNPALPVRVTTPITQHVDQCSACQDDMEALASLGLTGRQLYRLGQFLADQAQHTDLPAIAAWADLVAELRADKLTAAQLKQVCLSPRGRSRIRAIQQTLLGTLSGADVQDETCGCDEVSETDLFEYALPYGGGTDCDEGLKSRETRADHIRECSVCLKRLQAMQKVLFGMAERPDTDVVTIMALHDTESSRSRSLRPVSGSQGVDKPSSRIPFPMRRAIAAVLILVLGFIAITQIPPATAVEYERMQTALELVLGIHIVKVNPASGEVYEEIWGLPQEGQWLIDQKDVSTFWDLTGQTILRRDKWTGDEESQSISADLMRDLKTAKAGLFGVLPDAGRFPSEAQWQPVSAEGASSDTVTRELVMPSTLSHGEDRWQKRVYTLDAATHLPCSLELYRSSPDGAGMILKTQTTVTYPAHLDLALKREALKTSIADSLQPDPRGQNR